MKGETASNYQRLVFREEIVVQSKLKHNNILPITAICIPNMCMITPFCKEGNLYNVIHNSETSMSWKLRLKILVELASAIRYLHETPPTLIHRDIKSPNVLVYSLDANSSVCVYLCDFGSAIYSHRNCNERPLIDNPTWLAPEILKSTSQSYGFPVDIYSFGMIAWELVSRSKIFDGTPFFSEIEERIREGERPHIPYFIPEEYKAIITKCWAQDANLRPNWKWVQEMLDTMKANCEEYESEFGERKVLSQPRILQRKKIFKNNQPLSKAEESQKNSDRPSQKPKSSKEVFSLVANLVLPGNSSTPTATTPKKNQSKSVKMGKKLARKKGSHEEAEVVEVPVGDAVMSPTDEENCERLRSLTDNGERIVANTITASANPPVLKSNSENPNKAHALPSLNKEKYQKDRLLSLHRGQSARTHQINDDERNF
uniref:Protein kinase domain-containing protein n=1 Tax=Arcella intermedia TaxID=1963864 RepID=A0A6B2L2V2_9EUKA